MARTLLPHDAIRTAARVAAYILCLAIVEAASPPTPLQRRQLSPSTVPGPAGGPVRDDDDDDDDDERGEAKEVKVEIPRSGFIAVVIGCIIGGFLLCGWVIFLWNRWRTHKAQKKMEAMHLKLLDQDRAAALLRDQKYDFEPELASRASAPSRGYSFRHSLAPSASISQVLDRAPSYTSRTPSKTPGKYYMQATEQFPPDVFYPGELPVSMVPMPAPVDGFDNYRPPSIVESVRDGAFQRGEPIYRYGGYVESTSPYAYRPAAGGVLARSASMRSHVVEEAKAAAVVSSAEVSPLEGSVTGTSSVPESVSGLTATTAATDDSGTLAGLQSLRLPPVLIGGRLQQSSERDHDDSRTRRL